MILEDATMPEATSSFWKVNRIKTFNKWPFKASDNCNVECMAAAGFYVIGGSDEPDLVECFICGKQLDGWEPEDNPWSEHMKHQSMCAFVKLNKQDEKEWTVDELYDLYKKYKIKQYMHNLDKSSTRLKDKVAHLRNQLPPAYQISRRSKKSSD